MAPETAIALKEWSVLCAALHRGWCPLLARKGGVAEGPRGFEVELPEFWLLPTRFHQSADELSPRVAPLLSEAAAASPPAGLLRLSLYAVVVDAFRVETESQLPRLAGLHGLSDAAVHSRFHYRRPGLTLLLPRIYFRDEPWVVTDRPEYAGCHSWVPLVEPLATDGLRPVLPDAEFEAGRAAVLTALGDLPRSSPAAAGGVR